MLADGICCCPDTCKEEISFLKSFAATRNQLINPSVNRPSRKSRVWLHVRTYTRPGLTQCTVVPGTVHIYHIVFAIRFVFGALICCVAVRRSADRMQTHRYDKTSLHKTVHFPQKINYRFYSEFFIKPNIGTRIGKDSQILPIRCFTDIAKHRPDPMSDPIIGWSLLIMWGIFSVTELI